MSDIAIRVENLGKMYRIGAAQERHDTLRDALMARFRRDGKPGEDEDLWALKDVSFEVKRGEVVGDFPDCTRIRPHRQVSRSARHADQRNMEMFLSWKSI
jgi:hypothetical protein